MSSSHHHFIFGSTKSSNNTIVSIYHQPASSLPSIETIAISWISGLSTFANIQRIRFGTMLQLLLIVLVMTHMITAFRPIRSTVRRLTSLDCATGPAKVGSSFTSPASIGDMMYDIAVAIEKARDNDVRVGLVDLPIPVTGT